MVRALQLVHSSSAAQPPLNDRHDVQRDTKELADLMQRLALDRPEIVKQMLRFARKVIDERL